MRGQGRVYRQRYPASTAAGHRPNLAKIGAHQVSSTPATVATQSHYKPVRAIEIGTETDRRGKMSTRHEVGLTIIQNLTMK